MEEMDGMKIVGSTNIPIVALPPNLMTPPLEKGTESVVTPGTNSRMTICSSMLLELVILRMWCDCDILDFRPKLIRPLFRLLEEMYDRVVICRN